MNRLMKFNSILLIISILAMSFSFCLTSSAASATNDEAAQAFGFLKAVGIIDAEASYEPEKVVTRAEFVKLALSAMNMHPGADTRQIFADVDVKSPYAPYINAAYDMRIISGSGASNFEPDSPVTLPAAVKILCGILGYSELAELNGGFEVGYFTYASKYDVLDGFDTASFDRSTPLNFSQIMLLMSNALRANVLENGGVSTGIEIKNNENTLLSLYFDIYEATGIVNANAFTSLLSDETNLDEDQVEINDVTYVCGLSGVENYIGYELDFYYKDSGSGKCPEIVWFELSENTYVVEVDSDKIYATGSDVEYEDEDGKSDFIKINSLATFIYNGKMATFHVEELENTNGKVVFISNDGNKTADVVYVYDYKAMIVKGVSNALPNGLSAGGKFMSLESDYDRIITVEKNGIPAGISDIKADNVLLIAESKGEGLGKMHIIVSDTEVTGIVDMVDEDSLFVNGTEYNCDQNVFANIRPGVTYRFLIDAFGSIQSAEKINDVVYGYLKAIAPASGMDNARCKIFTENNRWVELDFADKIRFNGQLFAQDVVVSKLGTDPATYRQLIRYTVNDNAEVNMLETAAEVTLGSAYEQQTIEEDVFRVVFNGKAKWRNAPKTFAEIYPINESTLIFTIPDDLADEGFAIKSRESLAPDTDYDIVVYDTDELLRPKVITAKGYKESVIVTDSFMIVDSVRSIMNLDGNTTLGINGYWNGSKITVPVKIDENITEATVRALEKGDIIQFSVNNLNEIIELAIHKPDSEGYYLKGNYYAIYTVAGGKVDAVDPTASLIRLNYRADAFGAVTLNSSTKVYIYDTENETCENATVADILPGDKLLVKMRYVVANEIIVMR